MPTPIRHRLPTSRLLSIVLTAFALAAPACAAEPDISAGTLTNTPPMISYADDGTTLQGMIVDLADAMSKQMGRRIVFKPMSFNAIMPALDAKSIDIAFTVMNDTAEREKVLDFVDFYNFSTLLLIRKGNPDKIESLETMCGKTVSTVQGSTQIKLVEDASAACVKEGKPEVRNMQYAQPSDARLQVQTGRVSAFLGNSPVMVYLARTAGDGKIFEVVAGHSYQPVPVGIGVPLANTALRDRLKQSLDALIGDGTYLKILRSHGLESGALTSATLNAGKNVKL